MRGFPQRVLLALACFIATAAILGCPHPAPTPVGPPDAADASRDDARRPPAPVTCTTASAARGDRTARGLKRVRRVHLEVLCDKLSLNDPRYVSCIAWWRRIAPG